jgi:anti-sigma regulatory factor (Ser/Thr protein kinase)
VLGGPRDLIWRVDRDYTQGDHDAPHDARLAIAELPDLPRIVRHDLAIVVTELLTNAMRHPARVDGGRILLTICRHADVVCIEVRDPGSGFAVPEVPASDRDLPEEGREGGLGLIAVARISRDWGVSVTDTTLVWSTIAIPS